MGGWIFDGALAIECTELACEAFESWYRLYNVSQSNLESPCCCNNSFCLAVETLLARWIFAIKLKMRDEGVMMGNIGEGEGYYRN